MAALLFFVLLAVFGGAAAGDDVSALLEFKKGISDLGKDQVLGSWSPPDTTDSGRGGDGCPAAWRGVVCDGGAVVGVALDGLGLAGELKLVTLANMRSLQNLSLAGNVFSGSLPPGIGSLSSLRHLDLSGNRFYGPIPGRLADLSGLVHLNLSYNNFTSGFPTDGIRQLQNLRRIHLRSNSFWGNAGDLLAELRNAEHIDLSDNQFTGSVDLELDSLSSIGNTVKYMNLSHNRLSGGFFRNETVGAFKNLETLDLSNTGIGGMLPRIDSWFSLAVFKVAGNGLFGMMPQMLLHNSMRLVEVDLSRNGFSAGRQVDDIENKANKLIRIKNYLHGKLSEHTSHPIEKTERSVDMLLHGKKPLVEVAAIKRLMFYSHTLRKVLRERTTKAMFTMFSCHDLLRNFSSKYFKIPPPCGYGGRQVLGVAVSLSFMPEVTSDQKVLGAAPWAVALLIAGSSTVGASSNQWYLIVVCLFTFRAFLL